ncbi:MAG: MFS transporter [Candidatus Aminicenantes bacterium]|nr:MFS transporter [Candidatus Aminicenantes bacterium]
MNDTLEKRSFFHPGTKTYRYTLLLFVSLLTFGSYFAYDSIGAIENILIKALKLNPGTIGSLYSAYSIAAILIVFFGGVLTDKLGTRRASILFSGLVVLGALMVALSRSSAMLFAGRLVFGAGSESLVVAQLAILSKWFKGKELALSFGISLTISRLGTLFSFNTEAMIANYFGNYTYALWAAVLLCLVSLLSNVVSNVMDARGEKILKMKDSGGSDKIVLADIKAFKPSYWYVTLMCVTFYSAIFPFTALSTHLFSDKWGIPDVQPGAGSFLYQVFYNLIHMFSTAPGITSIVIFASMICAPFAGRLVDKVGRRATLMIIGSLIMIPSHLTMGLTKLYPAYPMMALGVAFVLVPAAMWPSIPLIVPKDKVGTAFGLTTMIQNIGLAIFPFLNGKLRELTDSYTSSLVMFAGLGLAGLVFAIFLKRADAREGGILEKSKI